MRPVRNQSSQTAAVLRLAEIKAAVEAFECGEINVFDALEAIVVEVEGYRAAVGPEGSREAA